QHIRLAVEAAGLVFGDPDLNQVAADAVAFGERVRRPRNSWTTCRLNSIEWVRCLAMGFLLESPVQLADSQVPYLCHPNGCTPKVYEMWQLASTNARTLLPRFPTLAAAKTGTMPAHQGLGSEGRDGTEDSWEPAIQLDEE